MAKVQNDLLLDGIHIRFNNFTIPVDHHCTIGMMQVQDTDHSIFPSVKAYPLMIRFAFSAIRSNSSSVIMDPHLFDRG